MSARYEAWIDTRTSLLTTAPHTQVSYRPHDIQAATFTAVAETPRHDVTVSYCEHYVTYTQKNIMGSCVQNALQDLLETQIELYQRVRFPPQCTTSTNEQVIHYVLYNYTINMLS